MTDADAAGPGVSRDESTGPGASGPDDAGTAPPWDSETVALPVTPPARAAFGEAVTAFELLPEDPGTADLPLPPGAGSGRDGAVPNSGGIHLPESRGDLHELFGVLAESAPPRRAAPRDAEPAGAAPARPATVPESWPFAGPPVPQDAPRARPTRREARILATGAVVALLVLVGIFLLGIRLAAAAAPPPAVTATPTAAPSPSVSALPAARAPGGTVAWDALAGGECLSPFTSAWAQAFTVVDCTRPHQAQLVAAAVLPGAISDPYPGDGEVAARAREICAQDGVIDLAAARDYAGVEVSAAYPADAQQWEAGRRSVYCFAVLSSGKEIIGSIAGTAGTAAPDGTGSGGGESGGAGLGSTTAQ